MNIQSRVKYIQELLDLSDVASAFLESLASRTRDRSETTVDFVVRRFGGSRNEVVDLFKRMAELGLGDFVVGRRSSPSRFRWHARMTEVGKAATGELDEVTFVEPDELEGIDDETTTGESDEEILECYDHPFKLRKDFAPIVLSLPVDLTKAEAERIAAFVKSLPLE